jgi:hypothetical protein
MIRKRGTTQGRIAQLVEHWSNKPAVRGSIPRSTSLFAPNAHVKITVQW